MQRNMGIWLVVLAVFCLSGLVRAAEYKLKDGTVYVGDVRTNTMSQRGVIIKITEGEKAGEYTSTIAWEKFSDDTLKELYKNEQARKYVELLIQLPKDSTVIEDVVANLDRPKKPELVLKPSGSPGLPQGPIGIMSGVHTGIGKFLVFILYLMNLYAAYEIAVFRRRTRYIVMGPAAVLPVIAPIAFLCLPTRMKARGTEEGDVEGAEGAHTATTHEMPAHKEVPQVHAAPEHHASVPAAPPEPKPVVIPPTQVYRRGESNLNRRFIETKFAGFFRVVPSEADRDLYLIMKTARGEFLGKRVTRITSTDITLQLALEGGGSEETFPLNDIFEIQVRHKDAPPQ